MTPIPRLKPYDGPAFLSYGFRPFFLGGALYAAVAILMWLPQYFGRLSLATTFSPVAWHAHEMLFGFVPAIVTGFLLTAIPNWTGRLPLQGGSLLLLLLAWGSGRVAIAFSDIIGWLPAMIIDGAFPALVVAAITREIVVGKNWRNLKIVAILTLILAANLGFHVEAHFTGGALYAERAGVALTLVLITLIGGRIVPSFTRNWIVKLAPGHLPAQADRVDDATVAISIVALALWIATPFSHVTGVALAVTALAQTARLARWTGWRTWGNPLVLVLHVAYGFIPLGFALSALAAFYPDVIGQSAGVHSWTAGAMGGMILAVMTRASLGHTGRALQANPATASIYVAVFISALVRVLAALAPVHATTLLYLSGFGWIVAFGGFVIAYGTMLMRPRL